MATVVANYQQQIGCGELSPTLMLSLYLTRFYCALWKNISRKKFNMVRLSIKNGDFENKKQQSSQY